MVTKKKKVGKSTVRSACMWMDCDQDTSMMAGWLAGWLV